MLLQKQFNFKQYEVVTREKHVQKYSIRCCLKNSLTLDNTSNVIRVTLDNTS